MTKWTFKSGYSINFEGDTDVSYVSLNSPPRFLTMGWIDIADADDWNEALVEDSTTGTPSK